MYSMTFQQNYAPSSAWLTTKTLAENYACLSLQIYFKEEVLSSSGTPMFKYYGGSNSTGINVIVNGEIWRGYRNGAGSGWTNSPANAWYEKDPVKYEYSVSNNVLTIDFLNMGSDDHESMFNGTIEVYGATPLTIFV